jgi:hypothetical protein
MSGQPGTEGAAAGPHVPHGPQETEIQQVGRGLSLTDTRERAAMGRFTQGVG